MASEIYFLDTQSNAWAPAYNVDPEIHQIKASFAEAKEYRAEQRGLTEQAGLNNYVKRRKRVPLIRRSIKESIKQKKDDTIIASSSRALIRENRAEERAKERSPIAKPYYPPKAIGGHDLAGLAKNQPVITNSLWDEVDDK